MISGGPFLSWPFVLLLRNDSGVNFWPEAGVTDQKSESQPRRPQNPRSGNSISPHHFSIPEGDLDFFQSLGPLSATPPVRLGLSGGNSGAIPERPRKRSESFSWNSPREYGWDPPPKPYNSRHLKAPEHFPEFSPPQYGWGRLFFRSGSGEGLSEPVMEFPAVLGAFPDRDGMCPQLDPGKTVASPRIAVTLPVALLRSRTYSKAFSTQAFLIIVSLGNAARDKKNYHSSTINYN